MRNSGINSTFLYLYGGNKLDYLLLILFLAIGLVIGAAGSWLLLRSQVANAKQKALADSTQERAELAERVRGQAQRNAELKQQLSDATSDLKSAQVEIGDLKEGAARHTANLEKDRESFQEKLNLLVDAEKKLADTFKSLSADALKNNNQSFLDLAKESLEKHQTTAKGDLEKRQQAIVELIKPVGESLKNVDNQLRELEKSREGAYRGLMQQVNALVGSQKELRTETANLVKALRTPAVRGRWGEIQLRRVVELAGMLNHCDFYEQQTAESEEGQVRPDLLVRLPAKKNLVVDSKVPLTAFLEALDATDDEARQRHLRSHAQNVRAHIATLGKKSYFERFDPTPEFVVLFMPGEVFFSAALEHDPTLIEAGVEKNVIIATPTTLIALLRAVAYGWRHESLAENAKQISELGRELYKRLSMLGQHFSKVGKGLQVATDSYNRAVGTLESRVLVTARKFDDLQVATSGTEIMPLMPVEQVPRGLQAAEVIPTEFNKEINE